MRVLLARHPTASDPLLAPPIRALGHEVMEVHSGKAAITAFLYKPFPLVIAALGAAMPGGFELCRRLRTLDIQGYVHLLLLTPPMQALSETEASAAGIDDWMPAPVDLPGFQARLEVASMLIQLHESLDILNGRLPICAQCGRVQRRHGLWQQPETLDALRRFTHHSHALCPACQRLGWTAPLARGPLHPPPSLPRTAMEHL